MTCCEMEKPIMMSPSGTSQDTVAESARRCMTDTFTGAGGRSGEEGKGRGRLKWDEQSLFAVTERMQRNKRSLPHKFHRRCHSFVVFLLVLQVLIFCTLIISMFSLFLQVVSVPICVFVTCSVVCSCFCSYFPSALSCLSVTRMFPFINHFTRCL